MDTKVIVAAVTAGVVGVGLVIATVANHRRTTKVRDMAKSGIDSLTNKINSFRKTDTGPVEEAAAQPI
jgi:hypothetical protein